ncbi:MAG: hypothetical protein ACMUIL_01690 [bacterium]
MKRRRGASDTPLRRIFIPPDSGRTSSEVFVLIVLDKGANPHVWKPDLEASLKTVCVYFTATSKDIALVS